MNPWHTGNPRFATTAAAGRALRSLGYDVAARSGRPWTPNYRDRLEIAAFMRDWSRATEHPISGPAMPSMVSLATTPDLGSIIEALSWALDHPALWAIGSTHPLQCCEDCHFAWEEREIWPHLEPGARARLQADHDRLRAVPDRKATIEHARRERIVMVAAGVPPRLLRAMDADHRALLGGEVCRAA